MGLFKRKPPPDRLTAQAVADFGRYDILGADESGVDPTSTVMTLSSTAATPDPAARAALLDELRRHAELGEWHKVGAWKIVRDFLEDAGGDDLIDAGLLAIDRMRITNLAIHLAPVDTPRYVELIGDRPPHDGFFGPPTFATPFGPSRADYLADAVRHLRSRQIARLPSSPGVSPGPVGDAVRSMWDLGMLLLRGPRVVPPDIRFEPNVVRPAVAAAGHVDHQRFAEALVDGACDRGSDTYGAWTAIGAARFIEDYLDPAVADSPACARAVDVGVTLLRDERLLIALTPEVLTPRERARIAELGIVI